MAGGAGPGGTYSPGVGFIYVFNLIIGVGALSIPYGFFQAGYIAGVIVLFVIGFLAYAGAPVVEVANGGRYVTVTFVVEVQSTSNAILNFSTGGAEDSEHQPLNMPAASADAADVFKLTRRVELGLCAEQFLGRIGYLLFYLTIIIYLWGDLAIYAVAVPTSLTKAIGGWSLGPLTFNDEDVYYVYLYLFAVCVVPWCFFDFQKTRYLQIFTLVTRNVAFVTMIVLSIIYIAQNGASLADVPAFSISGIQQLYGVAIYAFMCHHSLPGIIAPITDKSRLFLLFAADFFAVFTAYLAVAMAALLAYSDVQNPTCGLVPGPPCKIQDLFTLNFSSYHVVVVAKFLSLYPVLTLSTNFPLIAITLRNNMLLVFNWGERNAQWRSWRTVVFTLVVTVPPIAVAFATQNVSVLVSLTGSYAGLGIMFIFPALLVFFSRRMAEKQFGALVSPYSSPFGSVGWVYAIIFASVCSLGFSTFINIRKLSS